MNQDTPVIFSDGTSFYKELSNEFNTHPEGLFILAPSASGKTHFVESQTEKNWIDGDYLWSKANADLSSDDWNYSAEAVREINRRSDVITYQAKKLGFWIIGSSNDSLKPDAVVLLPLDKHIEYVKKRQGVPKSNGATEEDLDALLEHRAIIGLWKNEGVPSFESVQSAADYLAKTR